jgi:DNA repair protein RadC
LEEEMGAVRRTTAVAPPLRTAADVVRFAQATIGPWYASRAALVVVALDAANRVVGMVENRRRWSLRSFTAPDLVALSAELGAQALVLVQFVPNKLGEPSAADAHTFRALAARCAGDRTLVLDCIVVSGDRRWSLARHALTSARSN